MGERKGDNESMQNNERQKKKNYPEQVFSNKNEQILNGILSKSLNMRL